MSGAAESHLTTLTRTRKTIDRVLPSVLNDLIRLARIPGIAFPDYDPEPVTRSAELAAEQCRRTGIEDVRVLRVADGHPAVFARVPAPPGAPTVLLYAHHDVQPVGDPGAWASDPFEPVVRDGRLYGRGVADDKGGFATFLAALRVFDGRPPVGVTLLVEGEEESGSATLHELLTRHPDLFTPDVVVVADGENWRVGVPALTTSLRGVADCRVDLRTLNHPLHSGAYGGVLPDAHMALCRLLASLHTDTGTVAVAGLRHGTESAVDEPEEDLRRKSGVLDGVMMLGTGATTTRRWYQPSITITGIDARSIRDASNTLVPAAAATVSMRLAPGEDPQAAMDALVGHLRAHAPWGARVTVTPGHLSGPSRLDSTGPVYDAVRATMREAWDGSDPVEIGIGGSIPCVAEFAATFPEAALVVTGVADPDSRPHGVNESLHLGEWRRACLAVTLLLQRLAGWRPSMDTRQRAR